MPIEVLGPFTWLKSADTSTPWLFDAVEGKRCGVYLVTVATPAGWLIFLVGQTSGRFRTRFATHSREYFAGTYNVLDPEDLGRARRTVRWQGLWWRVRSADRYEEYLSKAGEVTGHVRALLQNARIFLLPFVADRRMFARLEATIVKTLYASPEVGHILDAGYHLVPRRKEEAPASVRLLGTRFLGLPQVLEI